MKELRLLFRPKNLISTLSSNSAHLLNVSVDTLVVKCLAMSALLPMVASPSRDLLRLEASSSSGICVSDRRRVSCASSLPPVESVADALRWGPEHKQITFRKLEPDLTGNICFISRTATVLEDARLPRYCAVLW